MTPQEFRQLKESLCRPVMIEQRIEGDCIIQVAVLKGGWIAYAALLDRAGDFVSNAPDHPVAKKIISHSKIRLTHD
jgi:hypothetical protein